MRKIIPCLFSLNEKLYFTETNLLNWRLLKFVFMRVSEHKRFKIFSNFMYEWLLEKTLTTSRKFCIKFYRAPKDSYTTSSHKIGCIETICKILPHDIYIEFVYIYQTLNWKKRFLFKLIRCSMPCLKQR